MADRRDAEETKEWDRFWGSGRVEDYLRYRNCCGREKTPGETTCCGDNDWKFLEERDNFR